MCCVLGDISESATSPIYMQNLAQTYNRSPNFHKDKIISDVGLLQLNCFKKN